MKTLLGIFALVFCLVNFSSLARADRIVHCGVPGREGSFLNWFEFSFVDEDTGKVRDLYADSPQWSKLKYRSETSYHIAYESKAYVLTFILPKELFSERPVRVTTEFYSQLGPETYICYTSADEGKE